MNRIITFALLFGLAITTISLQAQDRRFIDEIFTDVDVDTNVTYGVNASVLALNIVGEAIPQALELDVYQPVGDDQAERPLVVVFHSGNFLPFPDNGVTSGSRRDSSVIETCKLLARRGYVAAAADYRLGWNPIAAEQDERVFTLINAAYRGVQDANTCIRFFKQDYVDGGNTYGIDTARIVLWGIGTGGYVTLNTQSLDRVEETFIEKFTTEIGGQPFPMVNEPINGNVQATQVGIVPEGFPGFPAGDTLCYPNHVTFMDGTPISSDYQMTVNLGGALGDTSWIEPGQTPSISFQTPLDAFAPYMEGTVLVPGLGLPVVEVQGAFLIQKKQNELDNNDVFADVNFLDPISEVADSRDNGFTGLFPFPTGDPEDSAPWDFYAPDNINADEPPTPERARIYLDTIMNYFAPRACIVLDLDCDLEGIITSTRNLLTASEVGLELAPNPASKQLILRSANGHPMQEALLYDISGRLVQTHFNVNDIYYEVPRRNLPAGSYVLQIRFEDGIVSQQVMFK